jgi:predicted anti-sigma-YlaC factor YlaD
MTHPEELLAGHVDGTLPAVERAAVDSHLAECARCRQEVALAASARSALGSLAEVPAPSGVAARALQEAGAVQPHGQAGGIPRWYRIAGVAAAAAAALLVIAVTIPHIGKSTGSTSDARGASAKVTTGAAAPNPMAAAAPVIEIQHTNYDNASLSALSGSFAGTGAAFSTSTPGATESTAVNTGTPAQTTKALACIAKSAPSQTGQPTRLISARFQGTPAYLEVFLEGPGANQPPDSVVVWVFAAKDCAILSFSHARL